MKSIPLGIMVTVAASLAGHWYMLSRVGDKRLKEIQFSDSLQGWAIDADRLYRTTDGGRTWNVERNADGVFGGLAVLAPGHVLVSDGKYVWNPHSPWWTFAIYELRDESWSTRYSLYEVGLPRSLDAMRFSVLDTTHVWHLGWNLANPNYNGAVRTQSGGLDWERFEEPVYHYYYPYDASFTDTFAGWAAWDSVWKTTDAGTSWQVLTSNLGSFRICMSDSLNGWVLCTSGLMRTTNGGDSWTTVVARSDFQAMSFSGTRYGIIVGLVGKSLRTVDSGVTWLTDTVQPAYDLYSACLLDSAHAWAAGDSGVVLGMGDWAAPGIDDRRQLLSPFRLARPWPNPCRGTLWVQCRGGTGLVEVYDDCGRPIASVQCTSAQAEKLDLRGLPVGVYFARVASSPQSGVRFVLLR